MLVMKQKMEKTIYILFIFLQKGPYHGYVTRQTTLLYPISIGSNSVKPVKPNLSSLTGSNEIPLLKEMLL